MNHGYDPRLTSLRGLGALWVYAGHLVKDPITYAALGLGAAAWILAEGYLGVALFFCLSIYLLLGRLDARPGLTHYFRRRIIRVWPLYFVTVLGCWWFLWGRSWLYLWTSVTFTSLWIPGAVPPGILYPFWSLQLEEVVYLLIPVLAALSPLNREWVAWVLVAISLAYVVVIHYADPQLAAGWWTSWAVPIWGGVYGLGILAYLGRIPNVSRAWPLLFVPVLVPWINWYIAVLPLSVILASLVRFPPRALDMFSLVAVGEISYAVYLTQSGLIEAFGALSLVVIWPISLALEATVRGMEMLRRLRSVLLPREVPARVMVAEVTA